MKHAGALLVLAACGHDDTRDSAHTTPPTPDTSVGTPTPTGETATTPTPTAPGGNVLVILLDDVGTDKVGAYGFHPTPAPTPVIDGLAAQGVLFEQAYALPTCSPSRSALLTGRYPRRTGVGEVLDFWSQTFNLAPEEVLIPEVLTASPLGYTSVMSGKWHLATHTSPDPLRDPMNQGFALYAGAIENLSARWNRDDPEGTYFAWDRNEEGVIAESDVYATTKQVDDLVERVAAVPEPWFGYLALSAAHGPMHVPPADLTSAPFPADGRQPEYVAAMIEAADHEIGRMLAEIPPDVLARTTIMVLGDNGTADEAVQPPWDPERSKNSLYEGGTRVPLIVTGPLVDAPGRRSDALVHVVDLLPTIAGIAGVDVGSIPGAGGAPVRLDGVSFLPVLTDAAAPWPRETVYGEKFSPPGPPPYDSDLMSLRDRDYKVIVDGISGHVELYRMTPGQVDEGPNLLETGVPLTPEEEEARDRLVGQLDALAAGQTFGE